MCFLRGLLARGSCAPAWLLWRWATGPILLLLTLLVLAAVQVQAQRRGSSRAGSMPLAMLLRGGGAQAVAAAAARAVMQDHHVHNVKAHAQLLFRLLSPYFNMDQIFAMIMDTTNGNPALLRDPMFEHALYEECLQHVLALVVKDLMEQTDFAAAHNAAAKMSTWFKASIKRLGLLWEVQKQMKREILNPMLMCNTRFLQHLLVCERIVELQPAFAAISLKLEKKEPAGFNGPNRPDDPATARDFQDLYASLSACMPLLRALAPLAHAFNLCVNALSSETAYTSSLQPFIWQHVWEASKSLATNGLAAASVAVALQNSLLERLATHYQATSYYDAAKHTQPTFLRPGFAPKKLKDKLEGDARWIAAMMLDPACWADSRLHRGGEQEWMGDVSGFLLNRILLPCAKVDPAVAAEAAAAVPLPAAAAAGGGAGGVPPKPPSYRQKMAAIKGRTKPEGMHQTAFDAETVDLLDSLRQEHMGTDEEDEDGGGGDGDPFLQLRLALLAELAALERDHVTPARKEALQQNGAAALAGGKPYAPRYGHPLSEGTKARYELGPSMERTFPLLYFCAEALLAGSANSTAYNERMHSPAGLIYSKLRSRLLPDNVERLTLSLIFVKKRVKDMFAGIKTKREAEHLADKVEAEEEEGEEIINCLSEEEEG